MESFRVDIVTWNEPSLVVSKVTSRSLKKISTKEIKIVQYVERLEKQHLLVIYTHGEKQAR